MSEDLSFEEMQAIMDRILGRDKCDHIPQNVGGWFWECKCGKVQELRIPPKEQAKLREDMKQFHQACRSGKGTMTLPDGTVLKPYFENIHGVDTVRYE